MDKFTLVGGLAEVGAHLGLSHALKYTIGSNPVIQFKDAQGRYIWGVGTDNIINAAIGAGLYFVGRRSDRKNLKNLKSIGEGWLFALGITKLSELWLYFTAIDPIPETQILSAFPNLKMQTQFMSAPSFARYDIAPAKKGMYQ